MDHKKNYLYILLLGFLVIALNGNLFSFLVANRLSMAYIEPETMLSSTNNSIEDLIIEGAGYLIASTENINQVLKIIELQDTNEIDHITLDSTLNTAILNMQNAKVTYEYLIQKTKGTPYNETVLNALKNFPYEDFIIVEGLNIAIFKEVEIFLIEGDVTGILKQIYSQMLSIELLLNSLKTEIFLNKTEATITALKLNENTSHILIFASYVARVFATF